MAHLQQKSGKKRLHSVAYPSPSKRSHHVEQSDTDVMLSVLADAGCTVCNQGGPILAPQDTCSIQRRLERRFQSEPPLINKFLAGLAAYIQDPLNLRRILMCTADGTTTDDFSYADSIARVLLLVAPIQTQFHNILLEKLPEHFDGESSILKQDISRLILNQFRWLDFLVDGDTFTSKLLEVLSICPLSLKRDIIGLLPEIIGDQNNQMVVSSLEQMLQEDLDLIVPILDAFSNLNLEDELFEQVVTIALSSLRTVDAEYLPLLLKFLLQSATTVNAKRIIEQMRENLHFVAISDTQASRNKKLKGKSTADNTEVLILEAIRSGLRSQNSLCEAILKEIKGLDRGRDHKLIDVWLLLIIYANGGPLQKNAEKIIQKKVVAGYLSETLLRQCIQGRGESLHDYFPALLSVSESLLTCKEVTARTFGVHAYAFLFEEFLSTYHRQEVLGSLVMHTGSGVAHEMDSALETLVLLATKYSRELLPISSYINGILDYLEGFQYDHLHKVYRIFSWLALAAWSGANSSGSSIANELLMIVRKQIANPDQKYKRMGIIGAAKLVASLGEANICTNPSASGGNFLKSSFDEAVSLLQMVLETCMSLPMARAFFYDELARLINYTKLESSILEWVSKHIGEFETSFLLDLEGGQLQVEPSDNDGLQGEIWMNLDGDVSPICLNVLSLLICHQQRTLQALQFLPANFFLLASVERLTNQGSLGSIDALLGCPIYLPNHQLLFGDSWSSLGRRQKQISCLSLYYAANWIRELINTFSTQVADQLESITQVTRDEMATKLLKRLRNLVFLESLLSVCLKSSPLSLPQMHSLTECLGCRDNGNCCQLTSSTMKKRGRRTKASGLDSVPDMTKSQSTSSKCSQDGHLTGSLKQPTIMDALKKAARGSSQLPSQQKQGLHANSDKQMGIKGDEADEYKMQDICTLPEQLEVQRCKFRPLLVSSLSILSLSQNLKASCCADPAAELPLHLYLLRDLHYKLDCFGGPCKQFPPMLSTMCRAPSGLNNMSIIEFLKVMQPLFPSLRKHLNCAVSLLKEDCEACHQHWMTESILSGNPQITDVVASRLLTAESVFKEILCCLGKVLSFRDLSTQSNLSILKELLQAFESLDTADDMHSDQDTRPLNGTLEYHFCSAYAFIDGLFDTACSTSLLVAMEVVMSLASLINCAQACIEKLAEGRQRRSSVCGMVNFVPQLRSRLSASALKLLEHDWDSDGQGKTWKSKGDLIQKILQIYIEYSESPLDFLEDFACRIMPQVPSGKPKCGQDSVPGFPSLCSATFAIWYRVQHEETLLILSKLVKEITTLHKSKASISKDDVERLLSSAQKCVNVVVSLVSLTRFHDKVTIHAMAVKYGGKFVDTFLKGFEFLQARYEAHKDSIIRLVKELQKVTRTIQTLCSEAKGFKRTAITSKIPAVKRSMERYLFCVKALLHSTSHGNSFWMGNLKHKDLQGREVSSQLHVSEDEEHEPLINQNEQAETDSIDDQENHSQGSAELNED